MRITGGEVKGRTLRFPSESRERPTSDFLREALFNLLDSQQDKRFLDLFAGSGSVGLEAASRGAQEVYFLEKNAKLAAVIEKNIHECRFDGKCHVVINDVEKGLSRLFNKQCVFDIIFADPPYNRNLAAKTLELLSQYPVYAGDSVIVMQHSVKENVTDFKGARIHLVDQRKYGENVLTFFKWRKDDAG